MTIEVNAGYLYSIKSIVISGDVLDVDLLLEKLVDLEEYHHLHLFYCDIEFKNKKIPIIKFVKEHFNYDQMLIFKQILQHVINKKQYKIDKIAPIQIKSARSCQ